MLTWRYSNQQSVITDIPENSSASDAHIQEVKLALLLPSHAGAAAVAELLLRLQAEKAAVLCSETGCSYLHWRGRGGRSKKKLVHFHAAKERGVAGVQTYISFPRCLQFFIIISHCLLLCRSSFTTPPPHQLHSGRRPLKASSNVSGRLLVWLKQSHTRTQTPRRTHPCK